MISHGAASVLLVVYSPYTPSSSFLAPYEIMGFRDEKEFCNGLLVSRSVEYDNFFLLCTTFLQFT